MVKKLFVTWVLFIAVWAPVNSFAEKLVIVTSEWPPFAITENGQITGIHTEIVREFCKRNGIEADIRIVPWKRALEEVKEGTAAGIFSAKKTEERTQFLFYPSEILDVENVAIMALKGKGIKAAGLDDLKDKTFGVVRGYVYCAEFDNYTGLKKDESTDEEMLVKKLANQRTELAVGDEKALLFIGKKLGIQLETVLIVNEVPNYLAFSKALGEKGKALAEKFDQTIRQMRQEGVITKINDKYLK
ncbi:MAG: hypothetical protein BWK80_36320 [Desulfobacteraceae bacterium IS3]|nr:MAG: hypothetical protein BWK80_36320 [Desulfobacteraceae bacterium IS3]